MRSICQLADVSTVAAQRLRLADRKRLGLPGLLDPETSDLG
jgi:hypothetical protein